MLFWIILFYYVLQLLLYMLLCCSGLYYVIMSFDYAIPSSPKMFAIFVIGTDEDQSETIRSLAYCDNFAIIYERTE